MTNTNETAEPSGASAGSQPVAWQLWGNESDDGPFDHYITERSAHWDAERLRQENPAKKWFVVPLYRSPTLTDAEQLAVAWAAREADEWDEEDTPEVAAHADALRGLARRLF
jgi:hypothetical protein